MDFFRHRRLARRRSAWLVLLYIAALLATSASVSLVLGTLLAWAYGFAGRPAAYYLPFALGTAALVVSLSLHRIKRLRRGGGEVAAEPTFSNAACSICAKKPPPPRCCPPLPFI